MPMGTTSSNMYALLLPLLLSTFWFHPHSAALETITRGGEYGYDPPPEPEYPPSPPPPEPECPPPPPPPEPECPPPPPPPEPECPPPPPPPSPPPPSPPPPSPPPPSPPPPSPPPPSPPPPSPPPPSPPPPSPPPPPPQSRLIKARKVLLNFKSIINDPKGYTSNWKEGTDTCKFNGVRCAQYPNSREQAVAGLDLNQAGISGPDGKQLGLQGILDMVPELTFFHVNSNNFSGSLPDLLVKKFPFFFELDLSNNKFSCEFPNKVFEAMQLVFLDLRFNALYGPIPSQLFAMDLDVIFINNNKFSGNLPDNLGSTPARYLTFANNQLTGPIPSSIGRASETLTEVLFLGNKLEGCLPLEIGYLKKATVFDVSSNCLTGPIPLSFSCLQNIQFLNLAGNQLYGAVPEMVCQLPSLRNNGNLSLSNNYFTQVGPSCRDLILKRVLDVNHNCILGLPNQRPPSQCSRFFSRVKPCPNHKSLMTYIPCQPPNYNKLHQTHLNYQPPTPVTYNALKPHHR